MGPDSDRRHHRENLKPGLMEKLGFTYDRIRKPTPPPSTGDQRFGRSKKYEGPSCQPSGLRHHRAGHAGQCMLRSDPEGPPTWLGFALGDAGTGVYAAYSALLGYVNRLKTGRGESWTWPCTTA